MKFKTDKDYANFQSILEKELRMKVELRELENQIEEFEKNYLQNTWNDGNVLVGWPKVNAPLSVNAHKVQLTPKDKIFSLSSTSSSPNYCLAEMADKNITPHHESRFQQSYLFRDVGSDRSPRRSTSTRAKSRGDCYEGRKNDGIHHAS